MILYSKRYDYLQDFVNYEELAKKHNIETPKEVLKNVAYFDFNKNQIGYYGTARVGEKTRRIVLEFFYKLKTIREN